MIPLDLSIVIITKNESKNLPRCLKSLPANCEVIVLDSGSSDDTVSIAKNFGAMTQVRPFDHFANQKNAAIALATKNWIFSIDADEEFDTDLKSIVCDIVNSQKPHAIFAYKVHRRLNFLGQNMKFGNTNDYPIRLFQKGKATFSGSIHESLSVEQNNIKTLHTGILTHYSYQDLQDYLTRLNQYTSLVAHQYYKDGKKPPSYSKVVLRFFAEFVLCYFVKLGMFDGFKGFYYSLLSAIYSFIKYAKHVECHEKSSHQS